MTSISLRIGCASLPALAAPAWDANAITVQSPPLTANAAVERFIPHGANTDQDFAASIIGVNTRKSFNASRTKRGRTAFIRSSTSQRSRQN